MKPDSTKTVATVINDVLEVKTAQGEKETSGSVSSNVIQLYTEKKSKYEQKKLVLDEVESSISRCLQEKENATKEIKENEESWRSRFRKSRGAMTDELKNAHSQRLIQEGLASEFDDLIEELELEKQSAMLDCASAGQSLISAHRIALNTYADNQLQLAMKNLSPTIVRAVKLKLLALSTVSVQEMQSAYYSEPDKVVSVEIGNALVGAAHSAQFNMEIEPVLEEIGIYPPNLVGVDMALVQSPCRRESLRKKLKKLTASKKE